MTPRTQENSQNPCVTEPYPPGGGQPLLTTTRLGLPTPHSPGAHSLTTSPMAPRRCWGLWFLLHQGFSGLNPHLRTGILTESWEGFWNSAISGEVSRLASGFQGDLQPTSTRGQQIPHNYTRKSNQKQRWFLLVKHIKKKDASISGSVYRRHQSASSRALISRQ